MPIFSFSLIFTRHSSQIQMWPPGACVICLVFRVCPSSVPAARSSLAVSVLRLGLRLRAGASCSRVPPFPLQWPRPAILCLAESSWSPKLYHLNSHLLVESASVFHTRDFSPLAIPRNRQINRTAPFSAKQCTRKWGHKCEKLLHSSCDVFPIVCVTYFILRVLYTWPWPGTSTTNVSSSLSEPVYHTSVYSLERWPWRLVYNINLNLMAAIIIVLHFNNILLQNF